MHLISVAHNINPLGSIKRPLQRTVVIGILIIDEWVVILYRDEALWQVGTSLYQIP